MRGHLLKLIPLLELCHLHPGPGEIGNLSAQKGFYEIHFWDVSLSRELDVYGGREREGGRIWDVRLMPLVFNLKLHQSQVEFTLEGRSSGF